MHTWSAHLLFSVFFFHFLLAGRSVVRSKKDKGIGEWGRENGLEAIKSLEGFGELETGMVGWLIKGGCDGTGRDRWDGWVRNGKK